MTQSQTYTLTESWGSDAHTIATRVLVADLPAHARTAVLADPDAESWTVPALDGDRRLDDLSLVIIREA